MADMALFLGALVIVYVVPGPDMILLLETGLLRGRAPALAVALGLAIARAARHAGGAGAGRAVPRASLGLRRGPAGGWLLSDVAGVKLLRAGPMSYEAGARPTPRRRPAGAAR